MMDSTATKKKVYIKISNVDRVTKLTLTILLYEKREELSKLMHPERTSIFLFRLSGYQIVKGNIVGQREASSSPNCNRPLNKTYRRIVENHSKLND